MKQYLSDQNGNGKGEFGGRWKKEKENWGKGTSLPVFRTQSCPEYYLLPLILQSMAIAVAAPLKPL